MKEQQETNNASPAVPVNLQMWPSAPREEEKGRDGAEQRREREKLPGKHKTFPRQPRGNLAPPGRQTQP